MMIIKGNQIIVNYEMERELGLDDSIENKIEYLVENVKGDTKLVLDCSLEGLSLEFLKHLQETQEAIEITTTFGSSEMDDIYLYGRIDFVNVNYIILKESYINNNLKTKGTYFTHSDIEGEAIIFYQDIYSLRILEEEDKRDIAI